MKRIVLMALMVVGIVGSASAQRDDLYFVPKKKVKTEVKSTPVSETAASDEEQSEKTLSVTTVPAKLLEMDEDTYNRRGSYLTEQGDAVSEFAMDDEGFVLITEEGDTMWTDADTLRLTRVTDGEGWVNGFDGSDADYEYAMRIIRFRNPRYAIPVSSSLYWDVVYGSALWPSWDWNIYDDGMYAYVFPTTSNWYYWDYRMSYPFGWSAWSSPYYHGCHWGHHWNYHHGYHYGHVWYDPWFNPYFHDYNPGWHHGHHHGYYPHYGAGKPGWGGGGPKAFPNHRTSASASTRQPSQTGASSSRSSVSTSGASRSSTASSRTGSSAVRVVTDRTGSTSGASSAVQSSSRSRTYGNDEVVRRSTGSSSVVRSSSGSSSRSSYSSGSSSSSRSGYSSGSSSMSRSSGSTSSYSRPSSTRSSSSSVSRSSSSGSSSRSSYSSGSSRSSYSSGSSHSSYSSGSSHSSSYSSGSSYSGGSRSGGSYSGSSSSRSGGSGRR